MTAAQLDIVTDVRALLFGTDRDAADTITRALHDHGSVNGWIDGIRGLPGAAGQAIEQEAAGAIRSFLALDLIDLLAAGWNYSTRLREAARVTRDEPGRTEVVPMLTHRITSSHHPCVDVLIDGRRVGSVNVDLTVVFDIEGLLATVRQAQLMAARCARCTATGTLAIEGFDAAQRTCQLDVPGMLRLRSGIPLLHSGQPEPVVPPPPPSAQTQLWWGASGQART